MFRDKLNLNEASHFVVTWSTDPQPFYTLSSFIEPDEICKSILYFYIEKHFINDAILHLLTLLKDSSSHRSKKHSFKIAAQACYFKVMQPCRVISLSVHKVYNGTECFKKCKQLLEYQHLLLLRDNWGLNNKTLFTTVIYRFL